MRGRRPVLRCTNTQTWAHKPIYRQRPVDVGLDSRGKQMSGMLRIYTGEPCGYAYYIRYWLVPPPLYTRARPLVYIHMCACVCAVCWCAQQALHPHKQQRTRTAAVCTRGVRADSVRLGRNEGRRAAASSAPVFTDTRVPYARARVCASQPASEPGLLIGTTYAAYVHHTARERERKSLRCVRMPPLLGGGGGSQRERLGGLLNYPPF